MSRAFTVLDCAQGSPEWFAARCGLLTGTAAKDMLATIKTGEAAARRDLRLRLVTERLTGATQDDAYVNDEMRRGTALEPIARQRYEAVTGELVRETGFLRHSDLLAGASLDGDVDDFMGVVEIKCPKSATHLRYLKSTCPSEHVAQVTHALWLTGAAWCDFVSFDDRFPERLQLAVIRVRRSDVDVDGYGAKVRAFLAEVDAEVAALRSMAEFPAVLLRRPCMGRK